MAHFAEVDENNIVTQVLVVPDDQENRGQEFLAVDLGLGGTWIQTSYNSRIRYNYAGIGYIWDPNFGEDGAFYPPSPYSSWTLDNDAKWQPPVPYPDDDGSYVWDEEIQEWIPFVAEQGE